MATADPHQQTYLDTAPLLSSAFTPTTYAHALVHRTNNASDSPLDLSTPLARVLFDAQEADTLIDTLSTQNAAPIIQDTATRSAAASRVLEGVEKQVQTLQEGYERLAVEVGERYDKAEEVRIVADRMLRTLKLGRSVQRALVLGRQLEGQVAEVQARPTEMVEAARTIVALRALFARAGKGEEGEGLGRVGVVNALKGEIVAPAERGVLSAAQQVVRKFSMSSLLAAGAGGGGAQTFAQAEEMKSQAMAAMSTLYLLSPMPSSGTKLDDFSATLLIQALQAYLTAAITSSTAALARALATLPTLDRTLLEISARCQNIIALETLLSTTRPPTHPLLSSAGIDSEPQQGAFLNSLLKHLDTPSLPSYFWRSMASQMSPRVQEILTRGGVSARNLRASTSGVRTGIRQCVDRGSKAPASVGVAGGKAVSWEREAAVMVQSVVGPLTR